MEDQKTPSPGGDEEIGDEQQPEGQDPAAEVGGGDGDAEDLDGAGGDDAEDLDGADGDDDAEDLDDPADDAADGGDDDASLDLSRRVLCSDGACIGVIGPDGRCKECGKPLDPADAHLLQAAAAESAGAPGPAAGEDLDDPGDDAADGARSGGEDDAPDLEDRVLCSDGACIGVIGPDGRCKECGKPLDPADAA